MKKLVIDIETVGTPWEEHDPYVREYLIKGMNDAEAEEEKRRGARNLVEKLKTSAA